MTPIFLNRDYFAEVRAIYEGVKAGRLDREIYGFSTIEKTFAGEILNLDEAFSHYVYISGEMSKRGVDCFFMY